jgi:hypothetical protein
MKIKIAKIQLLAFVPAIKIRQEGVVRTPVKLTINNRDKINSLFLLQTKNICAFTN